MARSFLPLWLGIQAVLGLDGDPSDLDINAISKLTFLIAQLKALLSQSSTPQSLECPKLLFLLVLLEVSPKSKVGGKLKALADHKVMSEKNVQRPKTDKRSTYTR